MRVTAAPLLLGLAVAVAIPAADWFEAPAHAATTGRADSHAPPYQVKDGKVDRATYRGYLYYGDLCMRCHGPDGAGSSYAPSLVESLKRLSKNQYEMMVINGKQAVNTAEKRVMPAFGTNEDAVNNLDNIYAYLKARSDGALGRGHPEHMDE